MFALLSAVALLVAAAAGRATAVPIIITHRHADTRRQLTAAVTPAAWTDYKSSAHRPTVEEVSGAVRPVVDVVATDGVAGHTTYRLSLRLRADIRNVYAIYGDKEHPMVIPPAHQNENFGQDVGGVSPIFVSHSSEAGFDSWLTVGIDDGKDVGRLGHIGIPFSSWSATSGMNVTGGAVFWMEPPKSPACNSSLVAQLTVPSGSAYVATLSAQGHVTEERTDLEDHSTPDAPVVFETWDEQGLRFTIGPKSAAAPAPACSVIQATLVGLCARNCSECPANTDARLSGCSLHGVPQHLGRTFCGPECSPLQLAVLRKCGSSCSKCDVRDTEVLLGGCTVGAVTQGWGRTFCVPPPRRPTDRQPNAGQPALDKTPGAAAARQQETPEEAYEDAESRQAAIDMVRQREEGPSAGEDMLGDFLSGSLSSLLLIVACAAWLGTVSLRRRAQRRSRRAALLGPKGVIELESVPTVTITENCIYAHHHALGSTSGSKAGGGAAASSSQQPPALQRGTIYMAQSAQAAASIYSTSTVLSDGRL
jgi:hypothetical protein